MVPVRLLRDAGSWIRSAPGTYTWLALVGVTKSRVSRMSDEARAAFLAERSTNLGNLADRPARVLAASAVCTESSAWFTAAAFTAVHAPAERWLGTRRWLSVIAIGHVGATLLSQAEVARGIRRGVHDVSVRDVVDVGVSYGTATAIGVLTYRIPPRWRWGYLVGTIALYGVPAARKRTFTDYGHMAAYALGLACRGIAADHG
jgi:hypothetical protein